MKKIIKYSLALLAVFSLAGMMGCANDSSEVGKTPPTVKITYVPPVTSQDLIGETVQINSGTNNIEISYGISGVTMIQKFASTVKPVKMELKNEIGQVVGSTTDIVEEGTGYKATFSIPTSGVESFTRCLNVTGLLFTQTDPAALISASGSVRAQLASSLNVTANEIKVSFVAAGIVQEVTISVPTESDGSISSATLNAALAAQGVDMSSVTKVELVTASGTDPAFSAASLASLTSAVTDLSAAMGIEPPSVTAIEIEQNTGGQGGSGG